MKEDRAGEMEASSGSTPLIRKMLGTIRTMKINTLLLVVVALLLAGCHSTMVQRQRPAQQEAERLRAEREARRDYRGTLLLGKDGSAAPRQFTFKAEFIRTEYTPHHLPRMIHKFRVLDAAIPADVFWVRSDGDRPESHLPFRPESGQTYELVVKAVGVLPPTDGLNIVTEVFRHHGQRRLDGILLTIDGEKMLD